MKNVFNLDVIKKCSEHLANHASRFNIPFDKNAFDQMAGANLASLELKQRSQQISDALTACLPPEQYQAHIELLLATLLPIENNQPLQDVTTDDTGVAGWMIMPLADYVAIHAVEDKARLNKALEALREMTRRFTAEFAIRHLILAYPEECLEKMQSWLQSPCHHVRRLVSEGTRPKLPWAMQLPMFIEQPKKVLPLLEALKADESEYVRRSVANHLNDISKDHPDLIVEILSAWQNEMTGSGSNQMRLIKHAGRTLIKQGHPGMLATLGYPSLANKVDIELSINKNDYELGDKLQVILVAKNLTSEPQAMLVDYCIYHLRSRGQHIKKVFKWKSMTLASGETVTLVKDHAIKPISTRRYYSGEHFVSVLINGEESERLAFQLSV